MSKSLKGAMAAKCKFAAYRTHQQNTLSHSAIDCTAYTSGHVRLTLKAVLALDAFCKNDTCDLLKARSKSATETPESMSAATNQSQKHERAGRRPCPVYMPFLLESEHSFVFFQAYRAKWVPCDQCQRQLLCPLLTGSGSSIHSIFGSSSASTLSDSLATQLNFVWLCRFVTIDSCISHAFFVSSSLSNSYGLRLSVTSVSD